jgi:hypothetical protein
MPATQQFVLFSPVFEAAADTMQQDHRRARTVHPVPDLPASNGELSRHR